MDSSNHHSTDPVLDACLIARDPQAFDLLIEDMDDVIGENWGELNHREAETYLKQADAKFLDAVIVAVDEDDRDNLPSVENVLALANAIGVPALLVAEDLTAAELHRLIQAGARDFIPYPLPKGALAASYDKIHAAPLAATPTRSALSTANDSNADPGTVFVVQGLAGGTGATTFAVSIADELALLNRDRVCLIDLDLQFGSCGSHLNMRARETVLDLLTNIDVIDADGFHQALQVTDNGLHVLTAPNEIIPLDLLDTAGLQKLIDLAASEFDFVIVDMPKVIMAWSEVLLNCAAMVFCPLELDIRSAQAAARYRNVLMSESLPVETLRFVLNRAPKFTDLAGKSRVKRLGEALKTTLEISLPDGGRVIGQAADQGQPLSVFQPKCAYRRELQELAKSLADIGQDGSVAA